MKLFGGPIDKIVKVTFMATKEYCKADDNDEGEWYDDDDGDDLSMESSHGKSMTLTSQGMTSFSRLNNSSHHHHGRLANSHQ